MGPTCGRLFAATGVGLPSLVIVAPFLDVRENFGSGLYWPCGTFSLTIHAVPYTGLLMKVAIHLVAA